MKGDQVRIGLLVGDQVNVVTTGHTDFTLRVMDFLYRFDKSGTGLVKKCFGRHPINDANAAGRSFVIMDR